MNIMNKHYCFTCDDCQPDWLQRDSVIEDIQEHI